MSAWPRRTEAPPSPPSPARGRAPSPGRGKAGKGKSNSPARAPYDVPVPFVWTPQVADDGRVFFVNDSAGVDNASTTWADPRAPLPEGWVERKWPDGTSYFLNLNAPLDDTASEFLPTDDPRPPHIAAWAAANNHPLPDGIKPLLSPERRVYFADAARRTTSWTDPRLPLPHGVTEKKNDDGLSYFLYEGTGKVLPGDPRESITSAGYAASQRARGAKARDKGKTKAKAKGNGKAGRGSDSEAGPGEAQAKTRRRGSGKAKSKTNRGQPGASAPSESRVKAPSAKPLVKGAFQSHFEVVEPITRGGFGSILKIRAKNIRGSDKSSTAELLRALSGRDLVVKVMALKNASILQRKAAKLEASIHSRLEHPNIVKCYRAYLASSHIALVLEYCDFDCLHALIASRSASGPDGRPQYLPQDHALLWFAQLASAVEYLHDVMGVLHLDLKPGNVFLALDMSNPSTLAVRLGDFGFATRYHDGVWLKPMDQFWGTPEYTAPELLASAKVQPSPAADVWAMGVVLYTMLALSTPFGERSKASAQLGSIVPKLQARMGTGTLAPLPVEYTDDVSELVHMCLRKRPSNRPSAARILTLPVLESSLKYVSVPHPPDTPDGQASKR
ncbi:NEK protein kinase [Thecamonas trahens ATCC 50062]|uniref:non-specific serine/threonine protein kinase n=1 Tax=Thecamonas trahens ATCC 50062 TaxID=461836 RepID=A0A0L0DNN3_THETB|nr:NEK protein kinase [Thecamonas trahens ATCC 50062]KNC53606.1 NEK protein kinase [Thecamonas trahens ATCC 50062]|eukprot:XP_013761923.1 NEK protein kinase [Thecamonas trahens ATCC 50062]